MTDRLPVKTVAGECTQCGKCCEEIYLSSAAIERLSSPLDPTERPYLGFSTDVAWLKSGQE